MAAGPLTQGSTHLLGSRPVDAEVAGQAGQAGVDVCGDELGVVGSSVGVGGALSGGLRRLGLQDLPKTVKPCHMVVTNTVLHFLQYKRKE